MKLQPEGADWSWINFKIDPDGAGTMNYHLRSGTTFFYDFECAQGYLGDVNFTTIVSQNSGPDVEGSVSLTCR